MILFFPQHTVCLKLCFLGCVFSLCLHPPQRTFLLYIFTLWTTLLPHVICGGFYLPFLDIVLPFSFCLSDCHIYFPNPHFVDFALFLFS